MKHLAIKVNPLARSMMVVASVVALAGGVTFAMLSDTAALTGNTISSDTADLQVSNGGVFGDTAAGFAANDVVPGTGKTYPFYLKNGSGFDMGVTAHVATLPTLTGVATAEDVIVKFKSAYSGCTDPEVSTTLAALKAGPVALPCAPLHANAQGNGGADVEGNFEVTFDLDPTALTGASATVDAFDITFTGTQAAPVAPVAPVNE